MKKLLLTLSALATLLIAPVALAQPSVEIKTNMGTIVVELDQARAPISTENFLRYVKEGFYKGTIFHRVISDFMIQGGGFDTSMTEKPTHEPIRNEAQNGLKNLKGTIAMARTQDLHSATAQFYINLKDNAFLDNGYAVFGKVTKGLDVVEQIGVTPTRRGDVPFKQIVIESAKILSGNK